MLLRSLFATLGITLASHYNSVAGIIRPSPSTSIPLACVFIPKDQQGNGNYMIYSADQPIAQSNDLPLLTESTQTEIKGPLFKFGPTFPIEDFSEATLTVTPNENGLLFGHSSFRCDIKISNEQGTSSTVNGIPGYNALDRRSLSIT